jgi:hypothetical protein
MSRYGVQKSYAHDCQYVGWDTWRMCWVVDRYLRESRLRFPTTFWRDTDEAGARRFCKKWGIPFTEKGDPPRSGEEEG